MKPLLALYDLAICLRAPLDEVFADAAVAVGRGLHQRRLVRLRGWKRHEHGCVQQGVCVIRKRLREGKYEGKQLETKDTLCGFHPQPSQKVCFHKLKSLKTIKFYLNKKY